MKQGFFITFEGGDGSGKSTQIKRLKAFLEEKGYDVILTREPGGTIIGEKIRQVLLDPVNDKMCPMTEAMLYAAARAQHVEEIIKPSIASGRIVICDRFIDSSIAYQEYARGLGESVSIINQYAVNCCLPDLTFLLKLKPKIGSSRIQGREKDRIEQESETFHQKVYDGYEALERRFPDRIVGIEAENSIETIEQEIIRHINALLER